MWTAATEIHANSCLPELVYGNPYSAGLVIMFMWTQPKESTEWTGGGMAKARVTPDARMQDAQEAW